MAIEITCKWPGFRRAGRAHPAKAVYPDGTFTAADLETLRGEPLLSVLELVDEPKAPAAVPGPGDAHSVELPVEVSLVQAAPVVSAPKAPKEPKAAKAPKAPKGKKG